MVARKDAERYAAAVERSGLTIYDDIPATDRAELWIPGDDLEHLLDSALADVSLAGLPLRTRSKVVKEHVCHALGYPVPRTFRRTQPRFPGQRFDVYVQKSSNLQVWNEDLVPSRRYVIVFVAQDDLISHVKVVRGDYLAALDTTGTLTQKYQARLIATNAASELVADDDPELASLVMPGVDVSDAQPTDFPQPDRVMPIRDIFERLRSLIGESFADPGTDQERNRGAMLHRLVCARLGYLHHSDDGQFPDVRHQLLEVKLQTSPTIDLGLVDPHSSELLDMPPRLGPIRHCDVRYAVFFGTTDGTTVTLRRLFVTPGHTFFARFAQFGGNVVNRKLQLRLPDSLVQGGRIRSA